MPYYSFKEIWTPLSLFQVKFFRCMNDNTIFVKIGKRPRKQIFTGKTV